LPPGLGARIERGRWPEPAIFALVGEAAGVSEGDLFATFNMGLGMVLVAGPDEAEEIIAREDGDTFAALAVGQVVDGAGVAVVPRGQG
jgi:phosphoribosylformylglycinamidine cyclo-ligase